jgi:SpoVK/Ycf46/Vps4 family AAA+-type ATPase
MSKRERDGDDDTKYFSSGKNKRRPRIVVSEAPSIISIKDLIKIGKGTTFYKNINTVMIWRLTPYLEELNNLIGMETLKESIFYQILYYIQGMHQRNKSDEYLHTILMGPPGTGKTTVAYIIAKIYQAMDILSSEGPFKIAHRDDFVAGYLGQTAIKTQKLLNSCLGGVLFIDEVYSLGSGQEDKDSFSKEAIDTLCSFLSEHTSDFCCIAAGYEKDIEKCFFAVNDGLESRFQWKHKIEEYSASELRDIFLIKVKHINWDISIDKDIITKIIETNKEFFTNAGRDIINLISKCKMAHARRVLPLGKEHKFILTQEDLEKGFEMVKKTKPVSISSQPPMGMYT